VSYVLFTISLIVSDKKKAKKKAKKSKNLIEKYKDELGMNLNLEGKSGLNLLKVKKVKNLKAANNKVTTFEK
jgi:hypothetical protein